MEYLKAFGAGFVATLVFHQGVYTLLTLADPNLPAAFNMTATEPLGIPAVISLAFWGGVWGVGIWWAVRTLYGLKHWGLATLFGSLGPSVVAMLVVFPMKGKEVTAEIWVGALILNAAWGIGLALIMKFIHKREAV